jgi:hypothetical protein
LEGEEKGQKLRQSNFVDYFNLLSFKCQIYITGDEGSFSSGNTGEKIQQLQEKQQQQAQNHFHGSNSSGPSAATSSNGCISKQPHQPVKKKRNLPGPPDKVNLIYWYCS